jgi:hypothetical protein
MSNEEHKMSKVSQFVQRYNVDGYVLINVLEALARQARVSTDSLLAVALVDKISAEYLVGCVARVQQRGQEQK